MAAKPGEAASRPDEQSPLEADNDPAPRAGPPLGRRLCDLGLITEDQLQKALQAQARSPHRMLSAIMTELGFLSDESLAGLFADPGSAPAAAFDPHTALIDPAAVSLVPREIAAKHHLLPLAAGGGVVAVAVGQGFQEAMAQDLKAFLPAASRVELRYWPDRDLAEAIEAVYSRELRLAGILSELAGGVGEGGVSAATLASSGWRNPVVRLVNALVLEALRLSADAVQFEPVGREIQIRFRAAGMRFAPFTMPAVFWRRTSERLAALAGDEPASPVALELGARRLEVRLDRARAYAGDMAMLRIGEVRQAPVPLEELGLEPAVFKSLRAAASRPQGLILVAGPRRSGRVATLAALAADRAHAGDTMVAVSGNADIHLAGLQRIAPDGQTLSDALRQDPDLVLVDCLADPALARAAIEAALDGARVYAGLSAPDALGALARLRSMGIEAQLLASVLSGILVQRIAGRLCPVCKAGQEVGAAEQEALCSTGEGIGAVFEAKGCPNCRETGFKGRLIVAEMLPMDAELLDLIAADAPRLEFEEAARRRGLPSLREDAFQKLRRGEAGLTGIADVVDLRTASGEDAS